MPFSVISTDRPCAPGIRHELGDLGKLRCDGRHGSPFQSIEGQRTQSRGVPSQHFDSNRTVHDIDSSIANELNPQNHR
jgi:hypothetical protein